MKALAVLTDPNIWITDKIVAAAASGFLTPKFITVSSDVRIDRHRRICVNRNSSGVALDNEFKVLETGEVVRLSEKLEGFR